MNKELQIIMIISSLLFLCYIILMLRNKKIELKFTLSWLLTGICFLLFAIFPDLLRLLSNLLHIVEPVNTLFLFIIFLMVLIIFTLTIALSRNARRVKTLTQEIGIIKLELDKLSAKTTSGQNKQAEN
ncbi:MAG: DUF2304 domain-containing protein [Clostridiaceae bacterium]|nr:DUF2304 domain-containing protein [Clostridiaceae bacterium]